MHSHLLMYFGATWCGPCKRLSPTIDEIRDEFPNLLVTKVDIDAQHEFASEWNIKSVPTCLLIDENGDEVTRVVGNKSKSDLIKELRLPSPSTES